MALACRCCRVPLSAAEGCAVCDPIRPHLVSTDEGDTESAPLSEVSGEIVRALRAALRATRDAMKKSPADPGTTKQLLAVGNTMAKVLEAARKLQEDGVSAVKAMAFDERAELFLGWYSELPPGYRTTVRGALETFEDRVSKALPAHADTDTDS